MVMARDEDREDCMIRSSAAADPPFFLLHERYPLDVEPKEEMADSMDSELSDDSDQEGQTAQTEERAQTHNFYPFPDKKFFLLYCYAHGIMRPKVWL